MFIKHLFIAGCLCIFITFHTQAQTTPAQTTFNTDFQLWNDTQVIFPLNKDRSLNAVLWTFTRVGNDVNTVTDARAGVLLTKRINKNVTVGGSYLYRYSNPTFQRRRYESRYLGIATFTIPLQKKWTVVNRNVSIRKPVLSAKCDGHPQSCLAETRSNSRKEEDRAVRLVRDFLRFQAQGFREVPVASGIFAKI